jgi:hypothetical protein
MEGHLKTATVFAYLLDNQFGFGKIRFGLNSVFDLFPGAGDILAALFSLYLVWIAVEMDLPRLKIAHMLWNILVNFIIGLIPFLGDAVYIFRKANLKNLKILKDYAKRSSPDGKVIQPARYASA